MPRVWKQNYLPLEDGGTWIADQDRKDGSEVVLFPYDLDAKASKKRSTYWIGYKVLKVNCFRTVLRIRSAESTSLRDDRVS